MNFPPIKHAGRHIQNRKQVANELIIAKSIRAHIEEWIDREKWASGVQLTLRIMTIKNMF